MRQTIITLLGNEPEQLLALLDIANDELEHRLTLPASDGYDRVDLNTRLGHLDHIGQRVRDAINTDA